MSDSLSTTYETGTEQAMRGSHGYRRPVPVSRLVRVHLRIWRAQRGVVIGLLLILVTGLVSVTGTMATLSGAVTTATVTARFSGFPVVAFSLLWMAVGAVAAAAPFRSRWATVVLAVAPRRGRWLIACLLSFLLVAAAVTVVFLVVALAVTTSVVVAKGYDPSVVLGLGRPAGMLVALVVIQAGIGFLLGAATRSVAASIIIGYVLAPLVPLLKVASVDAGRWLDINGVLAAVTELSTDGHPVLPMLSAAAVWVAVPTLVAWSRLRSSVG
jgi:hypothetical protein